MNVTEIAPASWEMEGPPRGIDERQNSVNVSHRRYGASCVLCLSHRYYVSQIAANEQLCMAVVMVRGALYVRLSPLWFEVHCVAFVDAVVQGALYICCFRGPSCLLLASEYVTDGIANVNS